MESILLVEDELIVAMDIQKILQDKGYLVPHIATNGEEAISRVEELSPSIILMDIFLDGDIDGIETAERINSKYNIPIIFLTAHSDKVSIDRAKTAEPYGYILKPINVSELFTTIEISLYRHKMEMKLFESEERFSRLFEQAPIPMSIYDNEGDLQQVNESWLKLWNIDKIDDLAYNNIFKNPIYKTLGLEEEVMRAFKGEDVFLREVEYPVNYSNINGDSRYVNTKIYPLKDDKGQVKNVVFNHEDMTETIKVEQQLRRLATAIENASEDVIITNISGTIEYVNPAFEVITGYTKEEVIGKKPGILQSGLHDNDFYRSMWDTINGGNVWKGRIMNRHKNGSILTEDSHISPIRDMNKNIIGFVAIKRDISDQVEMEKQLVQAQKMEAIGNLAGGLAHDFNNILGGVMGSLSLMELQFSKKSLEKDSKEYKYLKTAQDSTRRAAELIKHLLSLSRKKELKLQKLLLNTSLKGLHEICKNSFPKSVILKFNIPEKSLYVMADSTQLEQVLLNLCVNASHAMTIMRGEDANQGGDLHVFTEIHYSHSDFIKKHTETEESRNYIEIIVKDNGIGIDDTLKEKIFEPFFTTKDKDSGTGLGLSMVYSIVKQHNGFIHIDSKEDSGTTFSLFLPLYDLAQNSDIEVKEDFNIVMGEGTIIVIDDEECMSQVIDEILTASGYKVITFNNSLDAIKTFKETHKKIDAVILDFSMPGQNAIDIYKELSSIRRDIKVLLASGYSRNSKVDKLLDEGIKAFIQKPFTAHQLTNKIAQLLEEN